MYPDPYQDAVMDGGRDDGALHSYYPDPDALPLPTWLHGAQSDLTQFEWNGIAYDTNPPEQELNLSEDGSRESSILGADAGVPEPFDGSSDDPDFQDEEQSGESDEDLISEEEDRPRKRQRRRRRDDLDRRIRRGVRRGYRKPVEPTQEFKVLQGRATDAFVKGDHLLAEEIITEAIARNPEIFAAYTLLAEIQFARGDRKAAVDTLFKAAHTRIRDADSWERIVGMIMAAPDADETTNVQDALYCFGRILDVKPDHAGIRYKRATLLRTHGGYVKAVGDYMHLRKVFAHDLSLLRELAECLVEIGKPEKAIALYDEEIAYIRAQDTDQAPTFGWMDANVYAQLFVFSNQPDQGLLRMKNVFRWLLGRGNDTFWDKYQDNDCEFDADDRPRRCHIPEFVPMQYPQETYGEGLPLELRIKLGLYRLAQGEKHIDETIQHMNWLEPESEIPEDITTAELEPFRVAGNSLQAVGQFSEALRYYRYIEQSEEAVDDVLNCNLAACFRGLGEVDKAETYYQAVIEEDENNLEQLRDLAKMLHDAGLTDRAKPYLEMLITRKRALLKAMEHSHHNRDMPIASIEDDDPFDIPQFLIRPKRRRGRRPRRNRDPLQHEKLRPQYLEMVTLREKIQDGDFEARLMWMELASDLIDSFTNMSVFYPDRRYERFFGYTQEARLWALHSKPNEMEIGTKDPAKVGIEIFAGKIPEVYAGIKFKEWLDIFLEYSLFLSEDSRAKDAYKILKSAYDANVFFHNKDYVFMIHIVWSICAVKANDSYTLCNVIRYLMLQYQFVTDSYRLFATLNRICGRPNLWYNSSASQKFILRQVKNVDFSLIGEEEAYRIYKERPAYSNKDDQGKPIKAKKMDTQLLFLYGQLLCTGGGYDSAIHYFYRALYTAPNHPLILLSLAMGYIHHSLKRQSSNRHVLIMQGLTFLDRYRVARADTPTATDAEKQEVEFNFGRVYMTIGLSHLAVPRFERVLEMEEQRRAKRIAAASAATFCDEEKESNSVAEEENYAQEAAYQLQSIWAISGQPKKAREVTEKWLVL